MTAAGRLATGTTRSLVPSRHVVGPLVWPPGAYPAAPGSRSRRRGGPDPSGLSQKAVNAIDTVLVHGELIEAAHELTQVHQGHPAGSVLRCYARAVHLSQLSGCADAQLAETASRLAEEMLLARTSWSTMSRRAEGSTRSRRIVEKSGSGVSGPPIAPTAART